MIALMCYISLDLLCVNICQLGCRGRPQVLDFLLRLAQYLQWVPELYLGRPNNFTCKGDLRCQASARPVYRYTKQDGLHIPVRGTSWPVAAFSCILALRAAIRFSLRAEQCIITAVQQFLRCLQYTSGFSYLAARL